MTELDETEPRPCSVCAALVRSTDMQAHMDWHATSATSDPTADAGDATTERP